MRIPNDFPSRGCFGTEVEKLISSLPRAKEPLTCLRFLWGKIIIRSNFNTYEFNSRELAQCLSTLLETVPFVFDHLWTQDRPIVPLTCCGTTGPCIDK